MVCHPHTQILAARMQSCTKDPHVSRQRHEACTGFLIEQVSETNKDLTQDSGAELPVSSRLLRTVLCSVL
jgi:hypothetical protein